MDDVQFIVPPGHPLCELLFDMEISKMLSQLYNVDEKDVAVPNSDLTVRLMLRPDLGLVIFKKEDQSVYVNILCFEIEELDQAFSLVQCFYHNYQLGTPAIPTMVTWIHSIPIPGPKLALNEIFFCQKITTSFFEVIYTQLHAGRN